MTMATQNKNKAKATRGAGKVRVPKGEQKARRTAAGAKGAARKVEGAARAKSREEVLRKPGGGSSGRTQAPKGAAKRRIRKEMATKKDNPFFTVLRTPHHHFKPDEVVKLFKLVDEKRVQSLAGALTDYITRNLPAAFEKKGKLADYRTNPYVLMTSASVMKLGDPNHFGSFLFNSKLYMALETSFGKQIEAAFVGQYPYGSENKWIEAPEKRAEFKKLEGLSAPIQI